MPRATPRTEGKEGMKSRGPREQKQNSGRRMQRSKPHILEGQFGGTLETSVTAASQDARVLLNGELQLPGGCLR